MKLETEWQTTLSVSFNSVVLVTSKQKHVYLCFLIWMNLKIAVMSGFVSESPRVFEPDTDGDGTPDFWHHSFSFPTTHRHTK